jgi:predicted DNA-binding protein (UPF0251 family)
MARKKIANALVNGKALRIEGSKYPIRILAATNLNPLRSAEHS